MSIADQTVERWELGYRVQAALSHENILWRQPIKPAGFIRLRASEAQRRASRKALSRI